MKGFVKILAAAIAAMTMLSACDTFGTFNGRDSRFNRVFIVYSLGFNNLSHDLKVNIDSLCAGDIPGKWSRDAIVVFSHTLGKSGGYGNPTKPVVYRLYKDNGKVVRDTAGFFHAGVESATTEVLSESLQYIRETYPSDAYSMLLSSHATGWLIPNYSPEGRYITPFSSRRRSDSPSWPETKSIGASYSMNGSKVVSTEMDLKEFAKALPMHFDCIIFDACLMGGVETAYELRDACDRILFSPTEVLTKGFSYTHMAEHMFSGAEADLNAIANDYYQYYMKRSGTSQCASVTVVDCRKMDNLADICAQIMKDHRSSFSTIDKDDVQRYFYATPGDSRYKPWFYDLRDAAREAGASDEELAGLDSALAECVKFHAETPKFFDVKLERCCGLSMYLPDPSWPVLNSYYKTLSWNSKTGLVE